MATRGKGKGVRIPLSLDKGQAEKDGKELGKELAASLIPVVDVVQAAKIGYELLKDAIGEAVEIGKEAIAAASQQEQAEQRLSAALTRQGGATADFLEKLNAANFARQQAFAISDDEQIQLQATAALLDVNKEHLDLVTRATIGLSESTGQSLDTALRTVVKTYHGNFAALQKLGIKVTDVDTALESLASRMSVAEARAATYAGHIDLLRENWSELYEELGNAVVRNQDVKDLLKDLNTELLDLIKAVKDDGPKVTSFISDIVKGLRDLVAFGRENKSELMFLGRFLLPTATVPFAGPALGAVYATYGAISDSQEAAAAAAAAEANPEITVESLGDELAPVDFPLGSTISVDKKKAKAQQLARAKKAHEDLLAEINPIIDGWRVAAKANIEYIDDTEKLQRQEIDARAQFRAEMDAISVDEIHAETERVDQINQARLYGFNTAAELQTAMLKQEKDFQNQLGTQALIGAANYTGAWLGGLIGGQNKIKDAGRAFFGGLLGIVGSAFETLGAATIAAGVASTPVPFLWGVLGGPAAIGAGFLLEGIGAALSTWGGSVAQSSRASSIATGSNTWQPPDQGRGGLFEPSRPQTGGGLFGPQQSIVNIINVPGDGSIGFVGNAAELARMISGLLDGQAEVRFS